MTREEQIFKASDEFESYRESLGVKDPIALDEIGEAFYAGAEWADAHPHWISVEDKLPKIGKDVLIWASGRNEAMIGYYKNWNWQRKTNVFHSYVDNDSWFNITHWMPIPPAPKKGGEQ